MVRSLWRKPTEDEIDKGGGIPEESKKNRKIYCAVGEKGLLRNT